MARSQLYAETYGAYHLMGFCTLAPGGPVSNFTNPFRDGRRGCNPRQGPEKSLVGIGIEPKALQSEDCHHCQQATGPDSNLTYFQILRFYVSKPQTNSKTRCM